MTALNRVVRHVLQAPLRGALDGRVCRVRYEVRRTGRTIALPTQYVRNHDGFTIAVAHPNRKSWWRNFVEERPAEIWVDGDWHQVRLHVVGDRLVQLIDHARPSAQTASLGAARS